ncbi:uncharacterized protein LOC107486345 [Arachis duranensis]|uniref:Uncharacterized protein LOC107486345 n=1 Tax=Arachis duranensis TaxID=130453 RepID=A0A6P4D704_ARADU|nr:uncharacterized protein LOC107486345 [Arachis duranensis]
MTDSIISNGASPGFDVHTLSHLLNHLTHLQSQLNHKSVSPLFDPSSIFFLHPSENSGVSIIFMKLDTKNYNEWSRVMLIALKSKNKLGFVDSTLPKPSVDDPNFSAWDKCNTFVVAWILQFLSNKISRSVIWNDIAVDIWNDLRHRYYQDDIFKIAELEEKLFSLKQGNSSITAYFTKLKAI